MLWCALDGQGAAGGVGADLLGDEFFPAALLAIFFLGVLAHVPVGDDAVALLEEISCSFGGLAIDHQVVE